MKFLSILLDRNTKSLESFDLNDEIIKNLAESDSKECLTKNKTLMNNKNDQLCLMKAQTKEGIKK